MADINLKPCPFCGGDADISHDHTVEENHACGCRICGIWFDTFNSDEAAEAWNTRAAIAAMTPTPQRCAECDCENGGDECTWIAPAKPAMTPQEAAKVLLAEWTEHGEGPLGDLCCYSMNDEGRMVPDVDGRWVEFTKIEAALFRAISEDSHDPSEATGEKP